MTKERAADQLRLRRPTEADHLPIVRLVDEWWGGRRLHHLLPRLWFQHFSGTSLVAETGDGDLAGFLVGFVSPDRPDTGYVHLVATNPNLRRRGIGRRLYERFFDDLRQRGVRRVVSTTWPGNRQSVAFHRRLDFEVEDGPGTQPLYGTPAFADYDTDGDERVVFHREI
ncbi:MAG TPA: GNAT family N-acetyltransferase [Vitreimonas sp.]|nr:GNAT family N-acetyltransferase [Vitreimonas sp.]